MKNKFLLLAVAIFFISNVFAQDTGKIIIRNASNSYPKFITSLNGIRLINDYSDLSTFSFLDETRYRLKIFQAGSGTLLTFTLNSEPKYLSKYLITKDAAGNYSLILESKSLMMGEPEPVVTNTFVADPAVIHTVAVTPTIIPAASVTVTNMAKAEFEERLTAIKNTSFDDKRLAKAKQVYDDEILSTNQVIEVVKTLSFDDSKLDFAKWAYKNTIDKKNYYKLDDQFSFSGSKSNLSDFIKKQPK
jgi:hypothetical protein